MDRARVRRRLSAAGRRLRGGARLGAGAPPGRDDRVPRLRRRVTAAVSLHRPRLLPDGGRRPAPTARARAGRHPDRTDRSLFPTGRGLHPPGDPRERGGGDHRQHRPAEQHQPRPERQRDRRAVGRGDPGGAEADAWSDGGVPQDAPRAAAAAIPRSGVLHPAGGHREPYPQFRFARPDRHPGQRADPGERQELPGGAADRA